MRIKVLNNNELENSYVLLDEKVVTAANIIIRQLTKLKPTSLEGLDGEEVFSKKVTIAMEALDRGIKSYEHYKMETAAENLRQVLQIFEKIRRLIMLDEADNWTIQIEKK